MAEKQALISIRDLSREFRQRLGLMGRQQVVHAVSEMSLDVLPGETLGVVGESGCGKSTLGRMCAGLLPPSRGDVFIEGLPLYDRKAHSDYKAFRRGLAGKVQMVFQDPYSSLNPRMRIGDSVAEPLLCSSQPGILPIKKDGRCDVANRVARMLEQVGMDADTARRYPHEFSGGQRQRVAIARALITRPAFVVCDEPTSSLDASVQSQVLNLLRDMQEELGLTYMFISHDLAVIRHMSDRVAVLYRGFLVEDGDSEAVLADPRHPYTRLLLDSVPGTKPADVYFGTPAQRERSAFETLRSPRPAKTSSTHASSTGPGGTVPEGESMEADAAHCPFAPRCPEVMPLCRKRLPGLSPRNTGRVRCFL